jgi:hypothetical protein
MIGIVNRLDPDRLAPAVRTAADPDGRLRGRRD